MTLTVWTRGTVGHAARNGKYYFVHRSSRLVRIADFQTLPVPDGWEQVSLQQWEAFRKETKKLNPKEQLDLFRSYSCSSITSSPSAKSSTSKETSTKQPGKPSSPAPEAKSSRSSAPSKQKSSSPSLKSEAKPPVKSGSGSKSAPTKRHKKPNGDQ